MDSNTSVFLLLEFSKIWEPKGLDSALFLILYVMIVTGNLLIISAVTFDSHLHTPMYFFLMNLALQDIGSVSVISPKYIINSFMNVRYISFSGCVIQVLLLIFFVDTDIAFLTVMAFDRYVAICNPLQYEVIMNRKACIQMVASVWISSLFNAALNIGATFLTPFCSNVINQFFCEIPHVLKLACFDSNVIESRVELISVTLLVGCFVFIIFTYVQILAAVLKIPSVQGRKKAFSTCFPHLIVFSIFAFTACFAYLRIPSATPTYIDYTITIMYSIIPPLLNPLIYSFRNKYIKFALSRLLGLKLFTSMGQSRSRHRH